MKISSFCYSISKANIFCSRVPGAAILKANILCSKTSGSESSTKISCPVQKSEEVYSTASPYHLLEDGSLCYLNQVINKTPSFRTKNKFNTVGTDELVNTNDSFVEVDKENTKINDEKTDTNKFNDSLGVEKEIDENNDNDVNDTFYINVKSIINIIIIIC